MNEKEKAVAALETLRAATLKKIDEAQQNADRAQKEANRVQQLADTAKKGVTTVQANLRQIDTALATLNSFEEPGLRVGGRDAAGKPALVDAEIRDVITYVMKDANLDFSLKDLVRHDELLEGLANPATRGRNLRNIWDRNLTALLQKDPAESRKFMESDNALQIAENNGSPQGLALTTLSVGLDTRHEEKSVAVHILRNNRLGRTLVVGEKALPSKLRTAFEKANIRYVNKNAKDALDTVKAALNEVLGPDAKPFVYDRLVDAHKYRNMAEDEAKDREPIDLPTALVTNKLEPSYPKYVVRKP